jgi:transcription-repair coupling factor (superfamily II helicase)
VADPRQRIEIYRKLAQADDRQALESLRTELRDRFGAAPPPVELLMLVAELRLLASDRGVSGVETRQDRLMLTRQGDYITLAGKFPRLTKQQPRAKLLEIRRLLSAL